MNGTFWVSKCTYPTHFTSMFWHITRGSNPCSWWEHFSSSTNLWHVKCHSTHDPSWYPSHKCRNWNTLLCYAPNSTWSASCVGFLNNRSRRSVWATTQWWTRGTTIYRTWADGYDDAAQWCSGPCRGCNGFEGRQKIHQRLQRQSLKIKHEHLIACKNWIKTKIQSCLARLQSHGFPQNLILEIHCLQKTTFINVPFQLVYILPQ